MNQVRHLIVDITCFGKDLDMRLMLRTKRAINNLSDTEKQSIRDLISSALLDSNVNGGLRWPKGKACRGQRYNVISVWYSKCLTYKNSSVRLRMRDVDRFDYRNLKKEFAREVVVKLTGIVSKLKEPDAADSCLLGMLKDDMKLVWEHFLHCDEFLNSDQILL
uniref:DUF7903 domain-containing protein n=1 Tax=Kalanchoe fedtschenkoi TaxID=63787 RepID=A0A7N0RAV7_KALFE